MKLSYTNLKKRKVIKSSTGLTLDEFEYLKPSFELEWENRMRNFTFDGLPRKRSRKFRKNSTFPAIEDMMVFILYEYRHNPTQEIMGLHFGISQPKVAMWIKVLEPILLKSLEKLKLVPTRENRKMNEMLFESVTILLDGSERPINRPKYDQEEYYSGKKTTYSKK